MTKIKKKRQRNYLTVDLTDELRRKLKSLRDEEASCSQDRVTLAGVVRRLIAEAKLRE
jgi:hypothetical protein